MIPSKRVGGMTGGKPFAKSDTWFSVSSPCLLAHYIALPYLTSTRQEFESHNSPSLILSKSPDSYIIGNVASYDGRQYPETKPGPEGQGFGHCFVISRRRIFNIVDPDATANHSALLKEMKEHFIKFWKTEDGPRKLLGRVRSTFEERNNELASDNGKANSYGVSPSELKADFDRLSQYFVRCKPQDFEFAFHAYPDNSVGHLHMHIFPKDERLRTYSTKSHDWKTIPIEAVLEVEQEDERRAVVSGSG